MFEKLRCDVLVDRVALSQLQRHREHRPTIKRHPRRPVGLLQRSAGRQRLRAVKHPDVVQPQKTAAEDMPPAGIFAVHPPGEIEQEFLKHPPQPYPIPGASFGRHFIHPPTRPRMHRRIHVGEIPLIRRHLPVRVHIPLAQQQIQLSFRKGRIDPRHRDHMESHVPRREPRILPLVRHRDHITRKKMGPIRVATAPPRRRWRRLLRIARQPVLHDIVIKLL